MLQRSGFRELEGKRVGLITNAAGINVSGQAGYRVLRKGGVDLRFIMAPEHGFSVTAAAGEPVGDRSIGDSLKVYSLYGASRRPDRKQLDGIDVMLFDLQDVGARCYTYISTMRYAMEACEKAGVSFMVLDRPNPVSPVPADGFMLDPDYASFVGAVPVPFLHAMTVGEIALLLKKCCYQGIDLRVVRMQGYSRSAFADEYRGFRFVSPSPNIRNLETALVYPATVFLEAANISEGRGTEAPFMQFGAPYIVSDRLKRLLEAERLPGVSFRTVRFTPASGKFRGIECRGLKMDVTDRYVFEPFRTGVAILAVLQKSYPDSLRLDEKGDFFDKLAGTPLLRRMLTSERSVEEILAASRVQVHAFEQRHPDRFIYR
ncbi:exo-beta-N-acetylmuramidase NamZ family protein [Prosthecochloris sp. GSB1]|uniref:exo-beta-N-acetylmuramidase NamZ family protein n=1 Tax=Prosthecochloris sp. GSB1 TaxID=281093 RepID=UPI001F2533D1|nr:DUF1343 domain-containing protein [Prosthecochloris sp. GSB1]